MKLLNLAQRRSLIVAPVGLLALAAGARQTLAPAPAVGANYHFGDFDRDGLPDLYCVQPQRGDRLFKNLGDGTFADVTGALGLSGATGTRVALWQDFDGDGWLDLYVGGTSGRLLRNDQAQSFVDVTLAAGVALAAEQLDAQWLDYDLDGRSDLHVVTARGDHVFHNAGGGAFERVALPTLDALDQPVIAPPLDRRTGSSPSEAGESGANGGPLALGNRCPQQVKDQATGNCLFASTTPTLGELYPLSSNLNVSAGGNVGVGTTSPSAKLDVAGDVRASGQLVSSAASGAPIAVSSPALVANLNADKVDGLDASAFTQLGNSIESSEITDSTVASTDLASDPASLFAVSGGAMLSSAGKIGIGGVLPTNALDVNGNIRATGSLGSTSNVLEFYANGIRVGRAIGDATSPGIVEGCTNNFYFVGTLGGTISGGGAPGIFNVVSDDYGTVAGGRSNQAGNISGTTSDASFATVSGGSSNSATGDHATVAGGFIGLASGQSATVGGGEGNQASGARATVPGGHLNLAAGSTSLAAGFRAKANHAGSFVWADSTAADFASSANDQFLVRATGGAGIGTNAPEARLHVLQGSAGTVSAFTGSSAVFESSGDNFLNVLAPDANRSGIVFGGPASAQGGSLMFDDSQTPGGLQLRIGTAVPALVVTSGRDVGIGVLTPEAKLHVGEGTAGTVTAAAGSIIVAENSQQCYLSLLGSSSNEKGVLFGDSGSNESGSIRYDVNSTMNGLTFRTNGNLTRMVIDSGGNVGIGTIAPTHRLELTVNDAAKPTSNTWTILSDRRLKTNIEPLTGALERLLKLRGVTFDWIDPASQGGCDWRQTGLIAQEVEEVFPHWIGTDAKGFKTLTVSGFEALTAESLRELRAEKDGEIAELRERLARAEKLLAAQDEALVRINERLDELTVAVNER